MAISPNHKMTRREAIQATGKVLGGVASLDGLLSPPSMAGPPKHTEEMRSEPTYPKPAERLRIATCQFPVSRNCAENAKYIREFMHQAAGEGANLLHTPEVSLSGYPGWDFPSFKNYNWDELRQQNAGLRAFARDLKIWLVLGSSHFLDESTKPTDCQYLIGSEGKIVNRYDKCFLTEGQNEDQEYYSAGNRLVTHDIRGVRIGLAICYDAQWPQIFIAYRKLGVTVMILSMSNAGFKRLNCLATLNVREVPTRCADNRIWAVCNNSSAPYSEWGSFVARPDATVPKQLPINQPGMLVHDFPDTLSPGGWYHNLKPMDMADNTIMHLGTPSNSPRQRDGQSEP